MHLIIGGNKLNGIAYATAQYNLECRDIFTCSGDGTVDFDVRCINCIEEYAHCCCENGIKASDVLPIFSSLWKDSVIVFSGSEQEDEQLRESEQDLLEFLKENADRVTVVSGSRAEDIK